MQERKRAYHHIEKYGEPDTLWSLCSKLAQLLAWGPVRRSWVSVHSPHLKSGLVSGMPPAFGSSILGPLENSPLLFLREGQRVKGREHERASGHSDKASGPPGKCAPWFQSARQLRDAIHLIGQPVAHVNNTYGNPHH